MKRFVIALVLGLTSAVSAKPAFLPVPLTYAVPVTPGTHIITNSGTLEVAVAETQHAAAARLDDRVNLAAARSPRRRQSSLRIDDDPLTISTSAAPLGADGRVVDTAEVAAAKAAHAAAHANERLKLAREAARSGAASDSSEIADSAIVEATKPDATIGPDGRIVDTSQVAAAQVAHVNGRKINLANEARTSDALARLADGDVVPLVLGSGVVATLVPIGVDGRPVDAPEVIGRGNQNALNNVKSVDALAVAGPALAYGRLVY